MVVVSINDPVEAEGCDIYWILVKFPDEKINRYRPIDQPRDRRTDPRTHPSIEMRKDGNENYA